MEAILTPLSLLASSAIVVLGWSYVHRKSAERDLVNKRRELRVEYLINAYRRLESASNRPATKETFAEVEKAMADIQLFGTRTQVELVREFCFKFVENRTGSLDQLLNDLRKDLRKEPTLESVPLDTVFLRYTEGFKSDMEER